MALNFEDVKEMLANEVIEKNMALKRCFLLEQEITKLKKTIEDKDKEIESLRTQMAAK